MGMYSKEVQAVTESYKYSFVVTILVSFLPIVSQRKCYERNNQNCSTFRNYANDAIVCKGIPHALETIKKDPLKDQVESIWVIGGSSVYKVWSFMQLTMHYYLQLYVYV